MSAILTKIINTVYIMKLVMTLLVRDEQDIIKENIDFHYAQGVDYFIVTDNLSVDKTPAILQDYVKKGIVHYLSQTDDNYHQCAWVTTMAQMAVKEFNADWVINNDADEFWWPKTGNLKQTFSNLAPEINTLQAQCYNFVAIETNNYTEAFYQYMIYREVMSLNPLGMPLPAKMAHKANEHIIVAQGNHSVEGFGTLNTAVDLIDILHFPLRSYSQFTNKIIKGGSAYQKNQILPQSVGITWRKLYEEYKVNNHLIDYYQTHLYDSQKLLKALADGVIVEDKRLYDFFN